MTMAWTAALPGAWRDFDPAAPDPGYFEFDWLSARHPDLYDAFALSSVGLIDELCEMLDFSEGVVADVGAGTGRSTIGLARRARHVIGIDAFPSVCDYGASRAEQEGLNNVSYLVGDRTHMPLVDNSVDYCVASWADLDRSEAFRITRPGGYLVKGEGTGAADGELGRILRDEFPDLIAPTTSASAETALTVTFKDVTVPDARFVDNELHYHEFSYVADYGDADEAAAIFGRIFGPRAGAYMRSHRQSTLTSRLCIYYGRVAK